MMASLTGMDISNASLYDGASALAEAVLMAIRANRKSKSKRILMPRTVHPQYRKVAHNICKGQGITFEELDFDMEGGHIRLDSLPKDPGDFAALVIPQPNYFGVLEDIDALTDWAHEHKALVIAVVNPTSLALLKAPGSWGEIGVDVTCGEGQPLGAPLSSGGPYFGFMACREKYVRQMPGRIIGRTVDLDGKEGFTLTLQAREQHIRRSKATSNICTNQGLLVTAATIYMSLVGPDGLTKVAQASHNNTESLVKKLEGTGNTRRLFNRPVFHESVMQFDLPTDELMKEMSARKILPGVDISDDYPELGNVMLVCATETKTEQDLQTYADLVAKITKNSQSAK
jgi:glycine dehydrogenase subunit 1